MKLFLAGNFPLMSNVAKEREMKNYVLSRSRHYNRLMSFFYEKGALNVMEVKKEVDAEKEEMINNQILAVCDVLLGIEKEYGKRKNFKATSVCPLCRNILDFAVYENGHCQVICQTRDCINWRQ